MTWVYGGIIIAIIVILIIFLKTKSKGKDPEHDASLSKEGQEELYEDYLAHGRPEDYNDHKQI